MARILVCADGFFRAFSPISLEPYIEMFINGLVDNGNEVMPYISHDIYKKNKKIKNWIRSFMAYEDVKSFDPEIIFSFNNTIDERFLKKFDCKCYIIASDTPIFWNNRDLILKYNNKYSILYFNDDFKQELKDEYKIEYKRQYLIPYTTDMKSVNIEQNKDICFIGNFNLPKWHIISYNLLKEDNNLREKNTILKKILIYYEKKGHLNRELFDEFLKYYNDKNLQKKDLESLLCIAFTNKIRNSFLNSLLDLDLNIYTHKSNLECFNHNYKIFNKCYFEKIDNLANSEKIYNESKISLNLPHFQVKTGLSWRVCDILATNSMLLTNPTNDLKSLFGNIIPTYQNEKDLRKKVLYYLKHEDERKDIVQKSQLIIEKKHRYKHLFSRLEEITEMKFIDLKQKGRLVNVKRTQKIQNLYYKKISN